VLVSAYGCAPNVGSEPGVGWNIVREIDRLCEVEVLTAFRFRGSIEAEMRKRPMPKAKFHFFEVFGRSRKCPLYIDNYLWQLRALVVGRRLHAQHPFDLVHHVTLASYSIPAFLYRLDCPFVFGPVAGGESTPPGFRKWYSLRGQTYEALRGINQRLNAVNPLIRATVRGSAWVGATTPETARELRRIGARDLEIVQAVSLLSSEARELGSLGCNRPCALRFVSVGNLLHLKGFDLGLRAFAQAGLRGAEYWIVGDGPERVRLERLVDSLGIRSQVRFTGRLPRQRTLEAITQSRALVHPSLHDSGGFVCLEAMAARRPVICLDTGGPALLVGSECGFKIVPNTPEQAIADLSAAMTELAENPEACRRMGDAGHARVLAKFTADVKARHLMNVYRSVLDGVACRPAGAANPRTPQANS
jgi:glycosyltransferase involved in cell wall biosynthesis